METSVPSEYRFQAAINAIDRMMAFCRSERLKELPKEEVELRLEVLKESWNTAREMEEILARKEDQFKMAEVERKVAETEELYFMAWAMLKKRKKELSVKETEKEQQNFVKLSLPHVKSTWGEFDGTITKWQGFRDGFVAAVHENDRVAPEYKFAYLKKSLTGRAAQMLGEWQLTESNYCEAWHRMNEVFNRKYATCRELLRQFFKLPSLQGPAKAVDLKRMANVTQETMHKLQAQRVSTEGWDMIVVHVLHERLDEETACRWEESRTSELPTIKDMCTFLLKRAVKLENAQAHRKIEKSSPSTSLTAQLEMARLERTKQKRPTQDRQEGKKKMPCLICTSIDHPMWCCPEFLSLSLLARSKYINEKRICRNCLKVGHTPKNCFQGPCTRCPGTQFHNSVLCPIKEVKKQPVFRVLERNTMRVKRDNEKHVEEYLPIKRERLES